MTTAAGNRIANGRESFDMKRLIISICVLMTSSTSTPPGEARGDDLDPEAIREHLKLLWDSLETISFTVEEYPKDAVDGEGGIIRTFTFASGNRRYLKAIGIGEDGRRIPMEEIRTDGRTTYTLVPPNEFSGPAWNVIIENQSIEHDELQRYISRALWLFAPGGKPLHSYLDDGGTLRAARAPGSGDPRVILSGELRGMPLTCELDPRRDYLPARVVLDGRHGSHEYRPTSHARDHGRWFPAEGVVRTERTNGRTEEWLFKVSGLQINRPVDAKGRFGPPDIPPGALVTDRVKGNSYVEGGGPPPAATSLPRVDDAGARITAPRTASTFPWKFVSWGAASIAFAGAIALRMRGRLREG
jgi:hypothetical protein